MRWPVRPTALGIKGALFYAMILVAFLAAPYTNLFFLLLAFLSALAGLGLLGTVHNLRGAGLQVEGVAPAPAMAGHEVRLGLDPGGRRRFQVVVQLRVGGAWHTVLEVPVLTTAERRTGRLPGLPRGVHDLQGARLLSRYPFGILERQRHLPLAGEVVSYPVPADRSPWADPSAMAAALRGQPGLVAGEPVPMDLRPWRAGDSLRQVHWKATARRRSPVVVERDGEALEGLQVTLDRRCAPETFEEALGLLTALLLLARDRKEAVLLRSQDHCATYGADHEPIERCLRWLARAEPLPESAPPPPPGPPTAVRLPARLREVAHG